ncbi:MAG: hypothetical protein XD60_0726 [Acetothermia bacterium 64_32]|nr:MAG: hypothetical protein XD60_0726 [Acetothermia bacterium 64_32]HAF70589.1 hypothetical protein [Candidatus Acetothermia bacterium]
MTGKVLLLSVLLGLGAGLVGGLIGVAVLSGGESRETQALTQRMEGLERSLAEASTLLQRTQDRLSRLEAETEALRAELPSEAAPTGADHPALKLAYVDLMGLMDELYQPLQNTLDFKNQELQDLRQRHEAGQIEDETYQRESMLVQAELLAAPLNWYLDLLDRLAASQEFSDLQKTLTELTGQLRPLKGQFDELKNAAEQGDLNTFIGLYQGLSTSLNQLDQLVSQVIQAMLAKATQRIAQAQGYALVLEKEDALYLDAGQLQDLTPQLRARVPELLP